MLFETTKKSSTCSDEDSMDHHHYLEDDIITDDEATLEDEDKEQLDEKGSDEEWLVLSNSEDHHSDDAVASPKKNDAAKESKSNASAATETLMAAAEHNTSPIDLVLVEPHAVVNVVEQVEPSILDPKAAATESEPKNWADHFAIELPKIHFDVGSVKQWVVDRKHLKSWLTTKNVQTLIICLLMSLLMKQRHVASRSTTTIRQDNEVMIQRLQQRLVELHAANEKYANDLSLYGLDRTVWSSMAIKCDIELSQLQTLHQELEDSIKATQLLATIQEEYHPPPMGNASQQVDEISLMPRGETSYKAMAIAGSTALIISV